MFFKPFCVLAIAMLVSVLFVLLAAAIYKIKP